MNFFISVEFSRNNDCCSYTAHVAYSRDAEHLVKYDERISDSDFALIGPLGGLRKMAAEVARNALRRAEVGEDRPPDEKVPDPELPDLHDDARIQKLEERLYVAETSLARMSVYLDAHPRPF